MKQKIQSASREWFKRSLHDNDNIKRLVAMTIRLNPCNEIDGSKAIKHFLDRLNRILLKSQYTNGKRKLSCLTVREGNHRYDIHYHFCIENPCTNNIDFNDAAIKAWIEVRGFSHSLFRNEPPFIQFDVDEGWIDYITKFRSKSDWNEIFDPLNTHVGS